MKTNKATIFFVLTLLSIFLSALLGNLLSLLRNDVFLTISKLIPYKPLLLLTVILVVVWIYTFIHFSSYENSSSQKSNRKKEQIQNGLKITRQKKKDLHNLSDKEKEYIKQYYKKNERIIGFESNATLQELCDKKILKFTGGSLIDSSTGKASTLHRINDWVWYYLKDNPNLLE